MEREEIIVACLDYLYNNKGRIHIMEYSLISDLIDRYRGERFRVWYYTTHLIREYYLVNGKKEGWDRGWHMNGRLWYECYYVNNEIEGMERVWHDNGQLMYEHHYINGRLDGGCRDWNIHGQLFRNRSYVKGKRKR